MYSYSSNRIKNEKPKESYSGIFLHSVYVLLVSCPRKIIVGVTQYSYSLAANVTLHSCDKWTVKMIVKPQGR